MADLLAVLTAKDARLLRDMASDAGASPEVMLQQVVRSYLDLVRSAPAALPDDPLCRLTTAALRKAGS